jgi:prepilin-type N-terminal cleavage/methylation domain-containing protein
MITSRHQKTRAAFTLTELLIVITVIGILIGFLAPAVIRALQTARESTQVFEIKQMELAIEQFKNDNGFYPPTIGANAAFEISSAADMQRYLNKMAPRNRESADAFPGDSVSRLNRWWMNVGVNLDETSSLQFWLSGLCKNKQYPLTGNVVVDTSGATTGVMTICAFNDNTYSDGTPFATTPTLLTVERNIYFDFKQGQLEVDASGAFARYNQTFGDDDDGDIAIRYLDFKSYGFGAYHDGSTATAPFAFFNPTSFQIVTYGSDGLPGNPGDITGSGVQGADNLVNFAEGRVEKYLNTN